jgi:hypothetical protein
LRLTIKTFLHVIYNIISVFVCFCKIFKSICYFSNYFLVKFSVPRAGLSTQRALCRGQADVALGKNNPPSTLSGPAGPLFPAGPLNPAEPVTEPHKIVPYYRLSLSTWPLRNNKELFCRFRRVKPGKSHTTGSLICAKPTGRRDQSTTLYYIKRFTSSTLLQTRFFVHESKSDSEFKQRKVN